MTLEGYDAAMREFEAKLALEELVEKPPSILQVFLTIKDRIGDNQGGTRSTSVGHAASSPYHTSIKAARDPRQRSINTSSCFVIKAGSFVTLANKLMCGQALVNPITIDHIKSIMDLDDKR
jgi:hypothetical protein